MFDVPATLPRAIAFFLPQYHPVAENNSFWGKGFTEWRNVVQARPRFKGHEQPHLPADLGFYDLRVPETRDAQASLAEQAGIDGFCYYDYWFTGRRLLHRPLDDMLASSSPDFPFMLCWANENWTRAWDGGVHEVLLSQSYSDADTRAYARHLAPIFADPRYIRHQDRPVFAVYNSDQLPSARQWCDVFRETLLREGQSPFLIRVERYLDTDRRPPSALGFDAALEFQPFSRNFRKWQLTRPDLKRSLWLRLQNKLHKEWQACQPWRAFDTHYDMEAFVAFDRAELPPDYPCFPGVCPSWDNSARRPPGKGIIFRQSSPELFEDWIKAKLGTFPDAPFLFINAWNEWAEGNHLEPCLRHDHAWLQATARALSVAAIPRM